MLFTDPNLIRISSLCLCSSAAVREVLVGSALPSAHPNRAVQPQTYLPRVTARQA